MLNQRLYHIARDPRCKLAISPDQGGTWFAPFHTRQTDSSRFSSNGNYEWPESMAEILDYLGSDDEFVIDIKIKSNSTNPNTELFKIVDTLDSTFMLRFFVADGKVSYQLGNICGITQTDSIDKQSTPSDVTASKYFAFKFKRYAGNLVLSGGMVTSESIDVDTIVTPITIAQADATFTFANRALVIRTEATSGYPINTICNNSCIEMVSSGSKYYHWVYKSDRDTSLPFFGYPVQRSGAPEDLNDRWYNDYLLKNQLIDDTIFNYKGSSRHPYVIQQGCFTQSSDAPNFIMELPFYPAGLKTEMTMILKAKVAPFDTGVNAQYLFGCGDVFKTYLFRQSTDGVYYLSSSRSYTQTLGAPESGGPIGVDDPSSDFAVYAFRFTTTPNECQHFFNGTKVGSNVWFKRTTHFYASYSNKPLTIGDISSQFNISGCQSTTNAKYGEFMVFDAPLTDAEIKEISNLLLGVTTA